MAPLVLRGLSVVPIALLWSVSCASPPERESASETVGASATTAAYPIDAGRRTTYSAYDRTGTAPSTLRIRYYSPSAPGRYPVAIVLNGTLAAYDDIWASAIATRSRSVA